MNQLGQNPKGDPEKLGSRMTFWFPLLLVLSGGAMLAKAILHNGPLSDILLWGRHRGGPLNGWTVVVIGLLLVVAGLIGFLSKKSGAAPRAL
jgi:hypothetical protein